MVQAHEQLEEYPNLIVEAGIWTGKTTWGAATLLEDMILHPGQTFWWPAPEDWHIQRFWEEFQPAAEHIGVECRRSPHCYAETAKGAKLYGVTMKNLKAIAAYHPHAIYADEVAKMSDIALDLLWLRMLKCRRVVLMSTVAEGRWERLRELGRSNAHDRWSLVQCTTEQAGIVPKEDIDIIRADIPASLAAQELDCVITQGPGAIFKNVKSRATLKPEKPIKGERYILTYDPADASDYGVATVWRGYRVVFVDRWRETGYRYQAKKVVDHAYRYNVADIVYDAGGAGAVVGEMIEEEISEKRDEIEKERRKKDDTSRVPIPFTTPVVWNNALKSHLVKEAATAIERGHIGFIDPDIDPVYKVFVDEHRIFTRRRSSSGLTYTYAAPTGKHDDTVSTTLLRMHGTDQPSVTSIGGEEPKRDDDTDDELADEDDEPSITTL